MKILLTGVFKKIVEVDEDRLRKSSLPLDRMADAFKTKNSPIHLSLIASKKNPHIGPFFFVSFKSML